MTKRVYRSTENRIIAGICGGIGEYFDIDPVLVRLLYLLATVFTGVVPGLAGYIIAMFIVPERTRMDIHDAPAHDSGAV